MLTVNCVVYVNRKDTCFTTEYFDPPKLVLLKPWIMNEDGAADNATEKVTRGG